MYVCDLLVALLLLMHGPSILSLHLSLSFSCYPPRFFILSPLSPVSLHLPPTHLSVRHCPSISFHPLLSHIFYFYFRSFNQFTRRVLLVTWLLSDVSSWTGHIGSLSLSLSLSLSHSLSALSLSLSLSFFPSPAFHLSPSLHLSSLSLSLSLPLLPSLNVCTRMLMLLISPFLYTHLNI
jgi:hypothetical protein